MGKTTLASVMMGRALAFRIALGLPSFLLDTAKVICHFYSRCAFARGKEMTPMLVDKLSRNLVISATIPQ
jgi:hypothetical protein